MVAVELQEANPMLGFRGAPLRPSGLRGRFCAGMRCNVVGAGQQGPTNVILMIPFCRRRRSEQVLKRMAECGLKRGENGLQIYDVRDP